MALRQPFEHHSRLLSSGLLHEYLTAEAQLDTGIELNECISMDLSLAEIMIVNLNHDLVGGLEPWNFEWLSNFPFSWECHHPTWRTHIVRLQTTNQFSIDM